MCEDLYTAHLREQREAMVAELARASQDNLKRIQWLRFLNRVEREDLARRKKFLRALGK